MCSWRLATALRIVDKQSKANEIDIGPQAASKLHGPLSAKHHAELHKSVWRRVVTGPFGQLSPEMTELPSVQIAGTWHGHVGERGCSKDGVRLDPECLQFSRNGRIGACSDRQRIRRIEKGPQHRWCPAKPEDDDCSK